MCELTKEDVGKYYYLVETSTIGEKSCLIIYYGRLRGIIPKYQFLDSYNSKYQREQNILFDVKEKDKVIVKSTTNFNVIYEKLGDALGANTETPLLHYSVLSNVQESKEGCI